MYVVREIMHCKPGKVRPMVEKATAMKKLMAKHALGGLRVLTDVAGDRYWTVIMEIETKSLSEFEAMNAGKGMSEEASREFETIMKGYHDLVEFGRREIYKVEE